MDIFLSSFISEYFGPLCQCDLADSFHFPFSLFFFCVTPSARPQQLPSFITLFSISSPFCSSGLYSLFCFIFFAPAQSIPQLPLPPQAISHSITFTSCSTKCLISTSVVILISFLSSIFSLFSIFSTTFRQFVQMLFFLLLFSLSIFIQSLPAPLPGHTFLFVSFSNSLRLFPCLHCHETPARLNSSNILVIFSSTYVSILFVILCFGSEFFINLQFITMLCCAHES